MDCQLRSINPVDFATKLSLVMKKSDKVPPLPHDVVFHTTIIALAYSVNFVQAIEAGDLVTAVQCCRINNADNVRQFLNDYFVRLSVQRRSQENQLQLFRLLVVLTQVSNIVDFDLLHAVFVRFSETEESSPRLMYFMELVGPTVINGLLAKDFSQNPNVYRARLNSLRCTHQEFCDSTSLDIGFPIPDFRRERIDHCLFDRSRG